MLMEVTFILCIFSIKSKMLVPLAPRVQKRYSQTHASLAKLLLVTT